MSTFDLQIPGAQVVRQLVMRPDDARDALLEFGFRDPDRVVKNLGDLADPRAFGELPDSFFRELISAPDPDMALNNFERMTKAVFSRAGFFRQLDVRPELCRLLMWVLGGSQFMADILVRDPESFYWLTEDPERVRASCDREKLLVTFDQSVDAFQETPRKLDAIRRTARRELLRIGVGDLAGGRLIQFVAADLSVLADVCLQKMIDVLLFDLIQRYGVPCHRDGSEAEFAVIGLGKLGGMELNFSSDIDLMFVYSGEGDTSGGDGKRVISNQEFFTKLSEQIVRVGTEVTEEGFLYRIDMRLRPDGAAGALTMPLAGYEGYYMRRGELWERQMLIKARVCAGSQSLGTRFLDMVQPFVYPHHFEMNPIDEIHQIKRRIESQLAKKGQAATHLKLRSGGIRDIEFVVQCLQLLVGRVHKSARSDNTLEAIRQLQRVGALQTGEADAMKQAYVFFRRLEHRMQMMHGRSDYVLPESGWEQQVIARTMGFHSPDAYCVALEKHRKDVQEIYASVFSSEQDGEGRSVGALVEMEQGDPEALELLESFGFVKPEEAHRNLIYMAFGHVPRIRGTRARQSFTQLAPALMQALHESSDPDQGLANLERLISAYGAGDTLFRVLTTHSGFRDMLLSICVGSQFLVQVIVRNPGLLDWLVRSDVLHQNPDAELLQIQLEQLVEQHGDTEALLGALNRFKSREMLRIGTRDLLGLSETFETFEALTLLADALVQCVYNVVWERLTQKWGVPKQDDGMLSRFTILGLGKMGGLELSFGSDLDIVFVYESDGKTDGERQQGNLQFFIDLAQQMTAMLEQNSPFGKLYPVDARLRPEGGNALLALSYDAYAQYLEKRGSTWERLALSRCRVVAGDLDFGQKMLDLLESFVVGQGFDGEEIATMLDVRQRMVNKTGKAEIDTISIKTDPGGIVDVEFIAQIGQLKWASLHPELRSANTLESLKRLTDFGYLTQAQMQVLGDGFTFLRGVEKVLRRQDETARTRLPKDVRALTALGKAMGFQDQNAFLEKLQAFMQEIRLVFDALLKPEHTDGGNKP